MAQFVHDGRSIDYTPSSAVTAGDIVVQEDLVGVAKLDIKTDTLGALAVEGVFDFPKATGGGSDIEPGRKLYWDDGAKVASKSSGGGNKYMGKSVLAAGEDDETVRVRLDQ